MTRELHAIIERLLLRGASTIPDGELLAVVLGSPSLARALMLTASRWHELTRNQLATIPRFGADRIAQVLALAALSQRLAPASVTRGQSFSCSSEVAAIYGPRLSACQQEVFLSLSLDAKHRLIAEHEVAKGTLTSVEVHPREVFRQLVADGAVASIMVHNHPSGDPTPSTEDRLLSGNLEQAGRLLGINVVDFIVVASEGFVSFADERWMRSVVNQAA